MTRKGGLGRRARREEDASSRDGEGFSREGWGLRIPVLGRRCRLCWSGVTGAAPRGLKGQAGGRESTYLTDFTSVGGADRSVKDHKKENEAKGYVYVDQRQKRRRQRPASESF